MSSTYSLALFVCMMIFVVFCVVNAAPQHAQLRKKALSALEEMVPRLVQRLVLNYILS